MSSGCHLCGARPGPSDLWVFTCSVCLPEIQRMSCLLSGTLSPTAGEHQGQHLAWTTLGVSLRRVTKACLGGESWRDWLGLVEVVATQVTLEMTEASSGWEERALQAKGTALQRSVTHRLHVLEEN